MKQPTTLVIPHTGALEPCDDRLTRLAQFLGVRCQPLFLDKQSGSGFEYISNSMANRDCCLVVNPRVLQQWTAEDSPAALIPGLISHFSYLLVHNVKADPFSARLVKELSAHQLDRLNQIEDIGQQYEIASDYKDICGTFSGISFGPASVEHDRVFATNANITTVQTPISIGGKPHMVMMQRGDVGICFLGSTDVLDINQEMGSAGVAELFSRLVPMSMALRYIFGEQCWRPSEHYASIIIDDPLLRPTYGFLKFESLLKVIKQFNLCVTIAFIPYNYRRSSRRIVQMFRENSGRLAICFHGNDHTTEELASADLSRLNTMVAIAERRMSTHQQTTGVHCNRVMVFPQEYFSVEAMKILKVRNFCAATSSMSHPAHHPISLSLSELLEPAVLRYGAFPLFHRRYIRTIKRQDVAFNLFFGKPILIVDHHDVFQRPETFLEAVAMINSVAPDIRWSDLETTIANSILTRTSPDDGSCQVRAYSGSVHVTNLGSSRRRYSVEWSNGADGPRPERVCRGGSAHAFEVDESRIRVALDLEPGESETLSLGYRNDYHRLSHLGFRWNARAYVRRRLSEVRDNYMSKNPHLLALAQTLRRRVLAGTS